jgi:hypothetical protein
MARSGTGAVLPNKKKTTRQGDGRFTKRPKSGGEVFHGSRRTGSPPGKARRGKKPYRGQGR